MKSGRCRPASRRATKTQPANYSPVISTPFSATLIISDIHRPSSYQWLRYLRIPIGFVQRIFKTVWILPLTIIGLMLLVRDRQWFTLVIILAVPVYYLFVQSVFHTERRYVYIVHFFFLIIIASLARRTVLRHRKAG
jgi:hypothetical protein